jgi:hypothetical protein
MQRNLQAFERLKRLQGEWRGVSADGAKELGLRYMVASKQSVVIEFYKHFFKGRLMPDEMVTVYHPNGADLMLTHYCTLGNQPRMIADLSAESLDTLRFKYAGCTNLSHADCLRMSAVTFHFESDERFRQTWHWFGKKGYLEPEHRSDDYDDLPDDGKPGEDTFTMVRTGS